MGRNGLSQRRHRDHDGFQKSTPLDHCRGFRIDAKSVERRSDVRSEMSIGQPQIIEAEQRRHERLRRHLADTGGREGFKRLERLDALNDMATRNGGVANGVDIYRCDRLSRSSTD